MPTSVSAIDLLVPAVGPQSRADLLPTIVSAVSAPAITHKLKIFEIIEIHNILRAWLL